MKTIATATKRNPSEIVKALKAGNYGFIARYLELMSGKMEPTSQQDQLFDAFTEGHRKIALRACVGPGKTTAIAVIGIIWMILHKDCKIIYTSTKAEQLRYQVWSEMNIVLSRCLPFIREGIVWNAEKICRLENPEGAVALAKVAPKGTPEGQAGWHHENLLIIIDESSGVDDGAIEALEGGLTNPNNRMIMVGNPTRRTGRFYDAFHSQRHRYMCLHFNGHDSPLVSSDFIEDIASRYGEESNIYRVRVLGDFPTSDDDALILLEYIEAAAIRAADASGDPIVIGVDPARSVDGDATGLIARSGNRVLAARQHWIKDLNQVQGKAKRLRDDVCAAWPDLSFGHFAVETDGLGAGVYDGLVGTGEAAVAISMAGAVTNVFRGLGELKPANMRAQLWLAVRSFVKDDGGSLMGLAGTPELETLMGELSGPRYKENNKGEILIEPKETMKKRGLKSPNLADALCLTFAPNGDRAWAEYYRSQVQ